MALSRAFLLPEPPRVRMHHPSIESHPRFVQRYNSDPVPECVRQYNPALATLRGRTIMAWRIQDDRGFSRVVAATIGKKNKLGRVVDVRIDAPEKTHIEDPRLCVVGGELFLFVATVLYGAAPSFSFIQRAFVIDPDSFQPVREIPLPYGKNGKGTHEKNWMPFETAAGTLGLVYQLAPEHLVIDTATGAHHRTTGVTRWWWGTVSGRSNAVLLPDGKNYVAMIGGHQAHAKRVSEYWFGAYTFSAVAPYAITGMCRDPLVWASDRTPAIVCPLDPRWNPIVVFPSGLIIEDGHALVAVGLNDSYNALMRFPLAELLANHGRPEEFTGEEKITDAPHVRPPGNLVRVRNVGNQVIGERGGPYKKDDEWFTSEDRAMALGKLVEVVK